METFIENASKFEIAWSVWGGFGWVMALIVCVGAIIMLINRYQDSRNGAIRLLAWQFAIASAAVVVGLTAVIALGTIALLLPPRTEGLDQWDQWWEIALGRASAWLSPLLFFIISTAFVVIAGVFLVIGIKLRRHYLREYDKTYTPEHHPNRRKEDFPAEAGIHKDGIHD